MFSYWGRVVWGELSKGRVVWHSRTVHIPKIPRVRSEGAVDLTNDMQFTICTTRKPLFHDPYDPYESYELKDTICDPHQFVYIGHGWVTNTRFRGTRFWLLNVWLGVNRTGTVFSRYTQRRYTQTRKSKNFQIPLYKTTADKEHSSI